MPKPKVVKLHVKRRKYPHISQIHKRIRRRVIDWLIARADLGYHVHQDGRLIRVTIGVLKDVAKKFIPEKLHEFWSREKEQIASFIRKLCKELNLMHVEMAPKQTPQIAFVLKQALA